MTAATPKPKIPRGAAAATSARTLGEAVQAAVRTIDENTLRPAAHRDAELAFQPRTLLALLTRCYARIIYAKLFACLFGRNCIQFRHSALNGERLERSWN